MADSEIGRLVYRITGDTSQLDRSVRNSNREVSGLGRTVGGLGKLLKGAAVVGAITLAAKAVIGFGKSVVNAASDAEETSNKFSVVFKTVREESAAAASDLSKNFGLSSNAAKSLLADTGDLLTGFGFSGDAALDLSTQVNELAVDLASFTNFSGGATGASQALTKALLGERESVKSLGISILDADVKAKVLELTQQGLTFETERQAKAYATMQIALEQSKNAIGDFERSSSSFANQTRVTEARINDLQVALGEQLLPVANVGVGLFNDLLDSTLGLVEGLGKFATSTKGIGQISSFLGTIAGTLSVLKNIGVTFFDDLKGIINDVLDPLENLDIGIEGVSSGFTILGTVVQLISGAFRIIGIRIGGVVTNVVNFANILKDTGVLIADFFGLLTGKTSVSEFKETLGELKEGFVDLGKGIVDNTVDLFKGVVNEVVDFTGKVKESANAMEEAYEESSTKVTEKVKDSLEQAGKAAKDTSNEIVQTELDAAAKRTKAEEDRIKKALELEEEFKGKLLKQSDDKIAILEAERDKKIALAEELGADTAGIEEFYRIEKEKLDEELAQKERDRNIATADQVLSTTQGFLSAIEEIYSNIAQVQINQIETTAQAQIDALDKELLGEEEFAAQSKAIEQQAAMEKWEIEKDLFNAKKAFSIVDILISTAQAIMTGFAQLGPIGGAIAAGVLTAVGITQIALVASQPPPPAPAFANGGIVPGNSFSGDNVQANVNSGEMVLSEQEQKELFKIATGSGGSGSQTIIINMDGSAILKTVHNGSRTGKLIIDARSVKS